MRKKIKYIWKQMQSSRFYIQNNSFFYIFLHANLWTFSFSQEKHDFSIKIPTRTDVCLGFFFFSYYKYKCFKWYQILFYPILLWQNGCLDKIVHVGEGKYLVCCLCAITETETAADLCWLFTYTELERDPRRRLPATE